MVMPLGPRLPAGHVDSLEHLSSEWAAAALTDLFLRTRSVRARVSDAATVRRLIRLDCRRRGCRVKTLGTNGNGIVVVYDDERYAAFRATDEGAAYVAETEDRMLAAFPWSSDSTSPLRSVPPDGLDPA